MYPYHNKIKQRIKSGELVRYEYVENYKGISPCLLLYFSTEPYVKPVRKHRFDEYETIFSQVNLPGQKKK
ncbi:hypothetical protein SAMN05444277_1181 [Parafilimonas terrae]|uniref:Uncharacterized protein n=1 Tax=Parafilimonas terrae TaxID=1465490 RepID=A0A1I5Z995_9BACT|nr:hypothetical protein SAMN05444277_1181 [Parafilimonas terrae]